MRPFSQNIPLDTLNVATCNVLNLARPERQFYANQEPYTRSQYERKVQWLGGRLQALNADILAVQEVWDQAALQAAIKASGLHYPMVTVPGAENSNGRSGAGMSSRHA